LDKRRRQRREKERMCKKRIKINFLTKVKTLSFSSVRTTENPPIVRLSKYLDSN
jgi:hypothetical protein